MFYNYFVELCNEAKLSPSKAAQQIGISKSSVSGWKNGSIPRDSQIIKIARFFKIPRSDIYEAINYEIAQPHGGSAPGTRSENKIEKAPVSNKKTETLMKLIEMLTPENQNRLLDDIAEMLKEQ